MNPSISYDKFLVWFSFNLKYLVPFEGGRSWQIAFFFFIMIKEYINKAPYNNQDFFLFALKWMEIIFNFSSFSHVPEGKVRCGITSFKSYSIKNRKLFSFLFSFFLLTKNNIVKFKKRETIFIFKFMKYIIFILIGIFGGLVWRWIFSINVFHATKGIHGTATFKSY